MAGLLLSPTEKVFIVHGIHVSITSRVFHQIQLLNLTKFPALQSFEYTNKDNLIHKTFSGTLIKSPKLFAFSSLVYYLIFLFLFENKN